MHEEEITQEFDECTSLRCLAEGFDTQLLTVFYLCTILSATPSENVCGSDVQPIDSVSECVTRNTQDVVSFILFFVTLSLGLILEVKPHFSKSSSNFLGSFLGGLVDAHAAEVGLVENEISAYNALVNLFGTFFKCFLISNSWVQSIQQ